MNRVKRDSIHIARLPLKCLEQLLLRNKDYIPSYILAGVTCSDLLRMLVHSKSIQLETHTQFILAMQDEAAQPARKSSSPGFAAKYAAQLMDEILTPIPVDLRQAVD